MPCDRVKRETRWPLEFLSPLLATGLILSGCGPGPEPRGDGSPEGVVRSFLRELDHHDVEGALAFLDEDFTFRSADGSFAADRESMPAMLSWDAEAEGRVEIEELRASADTVRTRIIERNRFSQLLDLEPWVVDAEFVVRGGRIQQETVREVTGEGPSFTERFHAALEPVRRWALEERPGEAEAVFEDGRIARYDGPTARRLIRLIESYRRDTEPGR